MDLVKYKILVFCAEDRNFVYLCTVNKHSLHKAKRLYESDKLLW